MHATPPLLPSKAKSLPRWIGFLLAGAILLLLPLNFFVSCQESAVIGFFSLMLFGIIILLCLATRPRTIGRFDPAAFAFGACLLNLLAVH